MKFTPTQLPDVILIEPVVHRDDRGFFLEWYHVDRFREAGITVTFVQDNHSRSTRGTLRGLHAQTARPQDKLVRVLSGEIYDVAVDVRYEDVAAVVAARERQSLRFAVVVAVDEVVRSDALQQQQAKHVSANGRTKSSIKPPKK